MSLSAVNRTIAGAGLPRTIVVEVMDKWFPLRRMSS